MPALRDPQYERFAREYVDEYLKVPPRDDAGARAYVAAGYNPHRTNYKRLLARPDVKARINELIEEALEWLDIRPVEALVRINRIAKARKLDYYEFAVVDGERVMRLRDLATLPARLLEAIADIERDADGRPVDVTLHDKMTAALMMLKHLGGVPDDDRPAGSQVNIFNFLSAEDQAILAEALDALPGGTAGTGAGTQTPGG